MTTRIHFSRDKVQADYRWGYRAAQQYEDEIIDAVIDGKRRLRNVASAMKRTDSFWSGWLSGGRDFYFNAR